MSTRPLPAPPRDAFSVWQRLFRGYGPLAVFAVLLLIMALAVPSKPQTVSTGKNGGPQSTTNDTTTDTSGGTTETSLGAAPGTPGATGTAGATAAKGLPPAGKAKGVVTTCTGRTEQVPGDPYSPPCIAFTGDNGGAPYHGINATEIHVAYRELNEKGFQQTLAALAGASLQDGPADIHRTVQALAEYFSKRFQMYGRKLVIDFYAGKGSNTTELLGGGRTEAQRDATTVQGLKSFADLSATSEPYAGELAKKDVMGFGDPYLSRPWHDNHRPYIWSIATDGTLVANEAAEYTGKRLCGKGAKWAGGAFKDKPRVIATFAPENPWYQESVTIARDTLSQYKGCQLAPPVAYQLDLGTMSNQAQNIIPKMKSAGVTTILCGCDPIMPVFLTGEMNRENYYPEFVVVGTALTDTDIVGQLWNQTEAAHSFGVSSLQAPVPPTQTIAYEAYKTVRNDEPAFTVDLIYYQMEMLAIGIQMAGPNLTPQTFEQGMFKYPAKLGPVGYWVFGPHDYTAANDVREIYWSPSTTSGYNNKQGAFVEPQPGVRWRQGQIPAGDPNIPAAP